MIAPDTWADGPPELVPVSPWFNARILDDMFVFPRLGITYMSIAKNACTKLKATLLDAEGAAWTESTVHLAAEKYRLRSWADVTGSRSIIAVRDPIRRIVSAYSDKFLVEESDWAHALVSGRLLQMGEIREIPDGGLSFEQFVRYLELESNDLMDRHWRPQIDFWVLPKFSHVANLEIRSDLLGVMNSLDLNLLPVGDTSNADFPVDEAQAFSGDALTMGSSDLRREVLELGVRPGLTQLVPEHIRDRLIRRYRDDLVLLESIQ